MGDLISRIELIKRIKGFTNISSEYFENPELLLDVIENQPTAYNVENVVEEIRRCSGNGYRDVDGDYVPPLIKTECAIDIVKRGGVDERT